MPAAITGPPARPWMEDCGTDKAYHRHRKVYREPPCWKCCIGHAEAERHRYESQPPGAMARKKREQRARRRAREKETAS